MTATLPRCVALYFGPGHAWYPARPTAELLPDETDVLWFPSPVLPDGCAMRWAEDREVASPHLTLDVTAIAELLYVAPIDPADRLDDDRLAAAVLAEADRCGCDLNGPICAIAQDAGDHPDACQARMRWCRQLAARLLGTEA